MLLKKKGYPKENELVLCTVTAVQFHSVFVTLDEYGNRSGMVHISEISPGRIRNIRDFVREGKKIVCVVLRIHEDKGHIDLSLRRVNDGQRRSKMDQIKQQILAEKILEIVSKQHGYELNKLVEDISDKCLAKYDSLYSAFEDVVAGGTTLDKLKVEKKLAKEITDIIAKRIKPVIVEVGGKLKLSSYEPNGMSIIKDAVAKAREGREVDVKYLGGGEYGVKVLSEDYKEAEKTLKGFVESVIELMEKGGSAAEFRRAEK